MFAITEQQKQALAEIAKAYDLKLIILHGSYATGKEHEGSDLDIAVLERTPLEFRKFLELYAKMGEVLGNTFERELDLKSLHHADPLFLHHVAKDSILLYGNSTDYNDFQAHAFVRYMDSKDLRDLENVLVHKYQAHLNQTYAR